jgi:hypothetical protein
MDTHVLGGTVENTNDMPIFHPKEPAGAEGAIRDGLTKFLTASVTGDERYAFMRREPVEVAHADPHRVYTVDLYDLAKSRLLKAAKEVAWSYPVFVNSEPIGELEMASENRADLKVRAFHKTPFTQAIVLALSNAEKSASTAHADYEMRFLKIPAVYFAALWLHAPKDDLLVPLREPPGRLESNHEYREEEIISALQPAAEQALRFEKEFGETGGARPNRK